MKKVFVALLLCTCTTAIQAQTIVSSDWISVKGTADSFKDDKAILEEQAQREAIQSSFGSSIAFADYIKEYSSEYEKYNRFVEMRSELLDGVWKGYSKEPVFYSKTEEIFNKKGKPVKQEKWYCAVEGYAKRIQTIPANFEYRILDQNHQIIAEHCLKPSNNKNESERMAFTQNDLLKVQFRSTQSGYLMLFLDDGNFSFRLLPYSRFIKKTDIAIQAEEWYDFFNRKKAQYGHEDEVDEIVLSTDLPMDAFRLYFIFSQTPFTKNFYFLSDKDEKAKGIKVEEGVERLPTVESMDFAKWLQQNRMSKDDLQIAIIDLMIDNKKATTCLPNK